MSKPILISGKVSHLNHFSNTSGSISRGNGSIRTRHRVMFRVDNTPVTFPGSPNLGEGDMVTLAYTERIGASILRNDTTGVRYFSYGWMPILVIIGILMLLSGLHFMSSSFITCLSVAGFGIWLLIKMYKAKQALEQSISQSPKSQSIL